ncbi:MAG TPA: polysaccharide pyruvyl transferase family protein [Kiritimatiellia bacterium]|nr:polysaccharide pyruvyl transferase family protein [Kiritimatiellia bacterium]HSA18622.1 polysaccharide pyruvyl transferase family protein [Kiritimatiellia bacterium]
MILILGGDTSHNRGDRAIRAALVDFLRAADPAARIAVVSRTPEADRAEWGVEVAASSVSRLLKNATLLRDLELVLWGGGHLLQDDSSKVKNVYWAFVLRALRRRTRCPIIGCGIGIGPIDTAWGRCFARQAIRQLDGVAARDNDSAEWVRQWARPPPPIRVLPDPAVGLQPAAESEARAELEHQGVPIRPDEVRIGIGLRRWFHIGRRFFPLQWKWRLTGRRPEAPPTHEQLLHNLAGALGRFSEGRRLRLLFFPMYAVPWEGDDLESLDLGRRLRLPSHILNLDIPARRIKALTGLCDLFVGVRLHSAILALGMNVPTLGIGYVRKSSNLFERLGLEEQLVDIAAAAGPGGGDLLLGKLARLHGHGQEIRSEQAARWAPLAAECQSGYADLVRDARSGSLSRRAAGAGSGP